MATDITRVLSADQLTPPMLVVGIGYPGGLADAIVLRLLGGAVMAGAGFVLGTAIGMVKAEDLSTSPGDRTPCGSDSILWDIKPRDPGYQGWFTLEASLEAREFLLWYGSTHAGEAGADWIMRPAVHVAFDDVRIHTGHLAPDLSLGGVLPSVLQHSDRYPVNDFSFA